MVLFKIFLLFFFCNWKLVCEVKKKKLPSILIKVWKMKLQINFMVSSVSLVLVDYILCTGLEKVK